IKPTTATFERSTFLLALVKSLLYKGYKMCILRAQGDHADRPVPERKDCVPPSGAWGNTNSVCIEAHTGVRAIALKQIVHRSFK
ncbi:MAG: hypothetical protein ACREPR_27145, partial [Brasilonema sp.]